MKTPLKSSKVVLLITAVIFTMSACATAPIEKKAPPVGTLEPLTIEEAALAAEPTFKMFMDLYGIPGASIAITSENEIIYSNSFGLRDVDANLPMTTDTLVGIGSATKMITALGTMILISEDKIQPSTLLKDVIDFPFDNPRQDLTIHHLLSHTAGFPELSGSLLALYQSVGNFEDRDKISDWQDWKDHMTSSTNENVNEPDQKWMYFNDGFTLLQLVIENVSGMKYADFIKERILDPLQMEDSGFYKSDFNDSHLITRNYQGATPIEHPYQELILGSGGLISSVEDLSKLLQFLIQKKSTGNNELFNAVDFEQMTKMHFNTTVLSDIIIPDVEEGYGYGNFIANDFLGEKLIYHSGNTSVGGSIVMYLPERKLGISLLYNAGQGEALSFAVPMTIIALMNGYNPEETFLSPYIEGLYGKLTGDYTTFRSVFHARIIRRGSFLYYIPYTEDLDEESIGVPLIPYDSKVSSLKFYSYESPGKRTDFEFTIDPETNEISFLGGRNLYHKR